MYEFRHQTSAYLGKLVYMLMAVDEIGRTPQHCLETVKLAYNLPPDAGFIELAQVVARNEHGDWQVQHCRIAIRVEDRKSTRLNPVTNAQLVCRLLLEKKNNQKTNRQH